LEKLNMPSRQDLDFVRNHRRSRKSQPGDGTYSRRIIFLVLISMYVLLTYFAVRYQKWELPRYQQDALIMFYAVYVLRTGVSNFYLRMSLYYSWKSLLLMGFGIFPMLTLPIAYCAEPFIEWNPGYLFWVSCSLYVIGSLIHSIYEFSRFDHKQSAKGHKLYRTGLAVIVRHPNYYGDLLIFLGWTLMSNNPYLLIIPVFQFWYFYFVLIPKLDEYLKAKYGRKMYEDYAYHVKGLIPFLM